MANANDMVVVKLESRPREFAASARHWATGSSPCHSAVVIQRRRTQSHCQRSLVSRVVTNTAQHGSANLPLSETRRTAVHQSFVQCQCHLEETGKLNGMWAKLIVELLLVALSDGQFQSDSNQKEGWWHLYQFGEKHYDIDIMWRPWRDLQIDLDFFLPFYGFRFNYSFIFPEGFVAFSYPRYIQPPYTMPNTRWPEQPDPTLIAAFMSEQSFVHVGDTRISHVWYRVVSRPINMINPFGEDFGSAEKKFVQFASNPILPPELNSVRIPVRTYGGQALKTAFGRVEDPELLDSITEDIRRGMVGARGFKADYALIVTWERMGYGGMPKVTELNMYDTIKKWQNTYQMILATDEIRTYVMLNYANVNWTSSTQAGALFGRGGKQSALVSFTFVQFILCCY
ncbi:unnamed protein product [Soboliphyme baturini]|uniref:NIDO domain-containing protein n=1 Tax=Soboliphyme baturini TaxID=241478 RepID=A0A183IGA4_9BILA|nr:unnamed protein product [Soboliphyme baturini]